MLLQGNLQGGQHLGIPVVDLEHAKAWYANILDFEVIHEPSLPTEAGEIKAAFLRLGQIVLECYQLVGAEREELRTRAHGHIDHFVIPVADIDQALQEALRRGAALEAFTPNGPVRLETFWPKGVKYVMLQGPMGEKVELYQRLEPDRARWNEQIGGWGHIGIPVTDFEKSKNFYSRFGFQEQMDTEIPSGDSVIKACIIQKDDLFIELYQLVGEELAEIKTRKDGHIDHLSFNVVDIDKAYAELQAAGLELLEAAPVFVDFWDKGSWYFTIRGPDGEKLEFNHIV